jgi:SAM-dependent methyltransferase
MSATGISAVDGAAPAMDTTQPSAVERIYPELRFGGYSRRDGTVAFYARIASLVTPASRVLDYGCGVGAHAREALPYPKSLMVLKGRVAEVIGTDVDADAATNPFIDRYVPLDNGRIPLPDRSVDLVVSDWGLEHFDEPAPFFAEAYRVLGPGGHLCLRTPNLFHYSSLGAALVPFKWHHALRRMLGYFHTEADVFPVRYRCNTKGKLRGAMRDAGFDAVVMRHQGNSHLTGAGLVPGLIGEVIERVEPAFCWHELHAFGRKRQG